MIQISLKSRAIRYLSLREHSIQEIKRKLSQYANSKEELEQTINWLIENNYLSEKRYINSFIEAKTRKYGLLKVRYLLEQTVEDKSLINTQLESYNINEIENICQLWQKKYRANFNDLDPTIQQKAIKWLLNKGFTYTLIKQAIRVLQDKHFIDMKDS